MVVDFEKFKNSLNTKIQGEHTKAYDHIVNMALYGDYDKAMDHIAKILAAPQNKIEILASTEAVHILTFRFRKIQDDLVLPILFKNLQSIDAEILAATMDSLTKTAYQVPGLKRKIYLAFFENGIDFVSQSALKVYKDISIFKNLATPEEKEEFILSFCQNTSNYGEASALCKDCLKYDDEHLNISAMQGLTYLLMRFGKIDFDIILPFINKYLALADTEDDERHIFAESLLADIAIVLPNFKHQAVKLLKEVNSHYCELYNL